MTLPSAGRWSAHRPIPALHRPRRTAVVLLSLIATLGMFAAGPAYAGTHTQVNSHPTVRAADIAHARALWVWDEPDPITLVTYALTHRVNQLFLAIPPDVTSSTQRNRINATIATAHAVGIRVDALGGDPTWVDTTNQGWVIEHWLTPALAVAGFDGIHVDVEPYRNPSWSSDQAGTVSRYLQLLTTVVQHSGPTHPVEADVPFWFNTVPDGTGETLDSAVLAEVHSVAIMAYRNTAAGADGTLTLAAPTLAAAAAAGKHAHIGQETRYLGPELTQTKQTFYGQTSAQMNTQLAAIDSAEASSPAYNGIAVHDYTGWNAISPKPPYPSTLVEY